MRGAPAVIAAVLTAGLSGQGSIADFGVDTNPPEKFSLRVVTTSRLLDPWEVRWGPDSHLWITERSADSVIRINPVTGLKSTVVTVPDAFRRDTQDGVLGLALHPGLLSGRGLDYLYVSFVYDADPGPITVRKMKVRRYTYEPRSGTAAAPVDVLSDLPSSDDHAGGRLALGPDLKLFLTLGDLAANHLGHHCDRNLAQDLPTAADVEGRSWKSYPGKTLRLNLDGSIPADNPLLAGVRSHVFSYGHRNPQGLAFGQGAMLYQSEHGPTTDDEVNVIRAGKNYGWPHVAGYADDREYVYANWSASTPIPCGSLGFSPFEAPPTVPQQKESAWNHPDFVPPLMSFFAVAPDYKVRERGNAVIAPSGIDVYTSNGPRAIPGWADSVLVTSLMKGALFRVKLGTDRASAVGRPVMYFSGKDRYRDVAFSPDGRTIFVATDNWRSEDHPGAILAYSYDGAR